MIAETNNGEEWECEVQFGFGAALKNSIVGRAHGSNSPRVRLRRPSFIQSSRHLWSPVFGSGPRHIPLAAVTATSRRTLAAPRTRSHV